MGGARVVLVDGKTRLTRREREVLALVARGETSRTIGAALAIAPSTVNSFVASAMTKLGARTRTQAAVLAAGGVATSGPAESTRRLSAEERTLVALVGDGIAVGEAARRLHISRRTAVRRLAGVRRALHVQSNREAVVLTRAARGGR